MLSRCRGKMGFSAQEKLCFWNYVSDFFFRTFNFDQIWNIFSSQLYKKFTQRKLPFDQKNKLANHLNKCTHRSMKKQINCARINKTNTSENMKNKLNRFVPFCDFFVFLTDSCNILQYKYFKQTYGSNRSSTLKTTRRLK